MNTQRFLVIMWLVWLSGSVIAEEVDGSEEPSPLRAILTETYADESESVAACVDTFLKLRYSISHSCARADVDLGGRKPWPWKGHRSRSSDVACLKPLPGLKILTTPQVNITQCCGGRCSASDVEYKMENGELSEACATITGWTEDKPFGGGSVCQSRGLCRRRQGSTRQRRRLREDLKAVLRDFR